MAWLGGMVYLRIYIHRRVNSPLATKSSKKARVSTTRRPGLVRGGRSGERTVQLFKMPDGLYWSIILWVDKRSSGVKRVTIGEIYDEALTWFFDKEARSSYDAYRAVPIRDAKVRSLWIDSRLLERAGVFAERDGVPRNRVLFTALVLFLKEFGPTPTAEDIVRLRKMKAAGNERGRPLSATE
jgi:hypothetical protein